MKMWAPCQKKNKEFQDGDSRALNQVQDPSMFRALCDCKGRYAHEASLAAGRGYHHHCHSGLTLLQLPSSLVSIQLSAQAKKIILLSSSTEVLHDIHCICCVLATQPQPLQNFAQCTF